MNFKHLTIASAVILFGASVARAQPTHPLFKIQGSVFLSNCNAQTSDVSIHRVPGAPIGLTGRTTLADGRVKMDFSFVVPAPEGEPEESYDLTPVLRAGVCPG